MSKAFPSNSICFSWQSFATDELQEWSVEYSPCMGDIEAFEIGTPCGACSISELQTMRGLHAMIGEAIEKAEEVPMDETDERNSTNG